MLSLDFCGAVLALFVVSLQLPLAFSQFISSLPGCVQNCIDDQDSYCEVTDINCLCQESAGTFLPDVITCMHSNCDSSIDNSLLLTPLQWMCDIAGAPIPGSAIQSAESAASSLAAQITTTVTITSGAVSSGNGGETTITVEAPSVTTETITTTYGGSTIAIIYPVTEWSTTTASGFPSTITSVSAESPSTGAIPGTGSTFTTITSSESSSFSSPTTITTSVAADETSSLQTSPSKTHAAGDPIQTNSSPFQDTNSAVARKGGNILGFSVLLALACVLF
jgi:hypothetical protein